MNWDFGYEPHWTRHRPHYHLGKKRETIHNFFGFGLKHLCNWVNGGPLTSLILKLGRKRPRSSDNLLKKQQEKKTLLPKKPNAG